jgi:hypothetical protein
VQGTTMTLPSYGYQLNTVETGTNKAIDYGYGVFLRIKNNLNLYGNMKILNGLQELGGYYKYENIKYLQYNKKLNIWMPPK